MTKRKLDLFKSKLEIVSYIFGCCMLFIFSCMSVGDYKHNKTEHAAITHEIDSITVVKINDSTTCLVYDNRILPLKNDSIVQCIEKIGFLRQQINAGIKTAKIYKLLDEAIKFFNTEIEELKTEYPRLSDAIKTQPDTLKFYNDSLAVLTHINDSLSQTINCYEEF